MKEMKDDKEEQEVQQLPRSSKEPCWAPVSVFSASDSHEKVGDEEHHRNSDNDHKNANETTEELKFDSLFVLGENNSATPKLESNPCNHQKVDNGQEHQENVLHVFENKIKKQIRDDLIENWKKPTNDQKQMYTKRNILLPMERLDIVQIEACSSSTKEIRKWQSS